MLNKDGFSFGFGMWKRHESNFFFVSDECNVYPVLGNYACHIIVMLAPKYLIIGNGKAKESIVPLW